MTMDTYGGRETDPRGLHKYLYCEGDPVDQSDPGGHDLDSTPDISSAVFATLGFDIMFAQAGGPTRSTATSSRLVKVLILVNPAGMPSTFDSRDVQQKLQAQMTAKVFNNLASGGAVQIKIGVGTINQAPGWIDSSRRQYLNKVIWGPAIAGAWAYSLGGSTTIDMGQVTASYATKSYNISSQFYANLLAHEVFWLNAGGNHDHNWISGGEISSGNPTYMRSDSEFEVLPASRLKLIKEFGFKPK